MSLIDFCCNCIRYKKKETAQWIHTTVFHFRFSKTGFDSKAPISFSGLWISLVAQLGRQARMCIRQHPWAAAIWFDQRTCQLLASPCSFLIFPLPPHLGSSLYLVPRVSAMLSLLFIKAMQRGSTLKHLPFLTCDCLSPFAVLENMCLQQVITSTTLWYKGIWRQSCPQIRQNNWS